MDKKAMESMLLELEALQISGGMDMNELLDVSDDLRKLLVWMVRKNGFQVNELKKYLRRKPEDIEKLLDALEQKGLVEERAETQRYQVNVKTTRLSRKYQVPKDVWKVFD